MADRPSYYWEQFVDPDGCWASDRRPTGADLAALRRGLGKEPATVPMMWKFHRSDVDDRDRDRGYPSRSYVAEHHALALYAVHQQSQRLSMHHPGTGFGRAMRQLQASRGDGSDPAIDRRFYAAVTSETMPEVAHHLRGLVQLLRANDRPIPLDYTRLLWDLRDWMFVEGRDRVRRRWGLQYHTNASSSADNAGDASDLATPDPASAG